MKKRIISKLNNNKGEGSLIFVFAMMFFFWMVILIVDIFRLTNVYLDAASLTRRITEVVAVQGGVAETVPTNYPTPSTYINLATMKQTIKKTMTDHKITKGDVKIKDVNTGRTMTVNSSSATGISIDYGNEIEVSLRYQFKFESLPNFTDSSIVFKITRKTGSQYKNRNSYWEGEEVQ